MLLRVLCWSFEALARGEYPARAPSACFAQRWSALSERGPSLTHTPISPASGRARSARCTDRRYPAHDHTGRALSGRRAALAGRRLAGDFQAVFAELRGDWKFLRESLRLSHYYNHPTYLCHACRASRRIKRLLYTDFTPTARHRARP